MSNVARVAGQAANTLVKPLDVEDVFSTYLYTGTGSSQTITNGIDLDGEGGLVWFKTRARSSGDFYSNHFLYDSDRGLTGTDYLHSNKTDAEGAIGSLGSGTSFLTNGFTTGPFSFTNETYASWTFRKAPKFFDVVTYTGNGPSNTQNISHNLGTDVGMLVVKATSTTDNWHTWHRGFGDNGYIMLNATNAKSTYADLWDDTAPTSTHFTVSDSCNTNNVTYVAYLFAHNNGDGDFGPDGDADIIKCGSYTGNGSSNGPEIDLGFEPQWVMIKNTTVSASWRLMDVMRGFSQTDTVNISPDASNAEYSDPGVTPVSTGFKLNSSNSSYNNNGHTFIYMAIRRPTAVPTSATEVFNIKTSVNTNPAFTSDHVIDLAMFTHKTTSDNRYWSARLASRGYLYSNATNAEATNQAAFDFGDTQFGHYNSTGLGTNYLGYFWKRAPNFCDVLAYTGNGTLGHTISHNLGVAPEMMWIKVRSEAESWRVYHYGLPTPEDDFLKLDTTEAVATTVEQWNSTAPTATEFSVSGQGRSTNDSGEAYIAYLFASLAGISKVGSVTHSGTTNVDCGFSSGASLVMLKRTDSTGDWYWWDSTSGIVSGNDPYFILNGQAAQVTNTDLIDPLSSGFTITSSLTAGDYIFYAIA